MLFMETIGKKVALAARRADELAGLVSEIETRGGAATFIKTDVSVAKDVERMLKHTIETFGRFDYAVNNAGIEGQLSGITDLPEEEWYGVLDINLKGTFLCMKHGTRAGLEPCLRANRGCDRQRRLRKFFSWLSHRLGSKGRPAWGGPLICQDVEVFGPRTVV